MRLRRRKFVRLQLTSSEEAFEGLLLGRWNGHYHLEYAKLVAPKSDGGSNHYAMDGIMAVREDRVLGYQIIDEVHR